MLVASALSSLALVVASVDIAEVLLLTVDVKFVISVARALSALALVVCSVEMAEVLEFTVEVKLVIAEEFAVVSVVNVIISLCAVAKLELFAVTVELKLLYKLIRLESLAAIQALLAAFLK